MNERKRKQTTTIRVSRWAAKVLRKDAQRRMRDGLYHPSIRALIDEYARQIANAAVATQ